MAKVRFLQSVVLGKLGVVANYNDEFDIEDANMVQSLVNQGLVDVLVEEKIETKPVKKPAKRGAKVGEDHA